MDLALKKNEFGCFGLIGTLSVTHEETMETAIPEYCPDIARILDTTGQVYVRSKNLSGEDLTVEGTVRLCILYCAEENAGVRSLTLSVPFTATTSDKRLLRCKTVQVCGKLLLAETHLIHPRKISLRVIPECTILLYARQSYALCAEMPPEEEHLQTRMREMQLPLLTQIIEKPCTFTDDSTLSFEAEELLWNRVSFQVNSLQAVGSKLIVKGDVLTEILCRDTSQKLHTQVLTFPFAQIVESPETVEDGCFHAEVQLSEGEARLGRGEDGASVGVTAGYTMQVFVCRDTDLSYVDDLYSTRYATAVQNARLTLPCQSPIQVLQTEEILSLGDDHTFAALIDCLCGTVTAVAEGENTRLRTTVYVKLLCLDSDGTPVSMERSAEVSVVAEGDISGENVTAACRESSVRQRNGEWELCLRVSFNVSREREETLWAVDAVTVDTEDASDAKRRPSIVLRRLNQEESLWDIAKQYQTTEAAILEANALGDAELPRETMLLIPRVQ